MQYRILGRTGIRTSVLTVGTWQLAGPLTLGGRADGFPDIGRRQAIDLIHGCEDLGINGIDTAEIYGGGEGERRVGEAIRGRRDRWIVTTKFGNRASPDGQRVEDTRPEAIRSSLEGSLQRLGTDHVDVYLYHSAPERGGVSAAREELDRLALEGKLRAYGISTDTPEGLDLLLAHDAVSVVQLPCSLRRHPAAMLASAKAANLGVMARGTLAAGFLSGKYFAGLPRFPADDIRSRWTRPIVEYAAFERLRPERLTMAAFAIRYVLDFDSTHTVVLGGKSLEHYRQAVKAVEAEPLSAADHARIDGLRRSLDRRRFARDRLRGVLRRILGPARRAD
jgi:aryl-alcohol dehydrogenase-like predicted oxidoreductase